MNPELLRSNESAFLHQVMHQAFNAASTSSIRQLSPTDRKILLKIINNKDDVLSNYTVGKDKKLDKHLKSIHLTLSGTPVKRSIWEIFKHRIQTTIGYGVAADVVNHALLNPHAEYRKHLKFDFQSLLPKEFFTEENLLDIEKLPDTTKQLIHELMTAYAELSQKNIPATLNDPVYTPLNEAIMNLKMHLGDEFSPVDIKFRPYLNALTDYVIPNNSQRPFLVFYEKNAGQDFRLESTKKYHQETTPENSLERTWADEGFIQPFRGLNLWEKFSLNPKGNDKFSFVLESRMNKDGEEAIRKKEIQLNFHAFRPNGSSSLTEEQTQELLKFFSRDTPYVDNTAAKELDFLTPEQQQRLIETHTKLCHLVTKSLSHLYHRN